MVIRRGHITDIAWVCALPHCGSVISQLSVKPHRSVDQGALEIRAPIGEVQFLSDPCMFGCAYRDISHIILKHTQ